MIHQRIKHVSALIVFLFLLSSAPTTAALTPRAGNHFGEIEPLDYWIEYLDAKGITTADKNGISFVPLVESPSYLDTILPEKYFGEYPLYWAGNEMNFIIHIKNVGKRTFRNLKILAVQEFLNVEGAAGEPFPENVEQEWFVQELKSGEEIELEGEMVIPNVPTSGIDQTHLQILHWNSINKRPEVIGGGRVIIDDPQAGRMVSQNHIKRAISHFKRLRTST